MGKPKPYDWLASHNEPGQTFDEYLDANPTRPTKERNKIYVLPLGTFTPQQKKIIEITTGYLEAFYDLPVEQLPARILADRIPADASRLSRETHKRQFRAGYINDKMLLPMFPRDATALIALTNEDLFPEASKSYVFGEASLKDRVGVWSLARLGANTDYDTFLRRTLKIAAHETGHMFRLRHCTKYECVMSGTNQLAETDSRPIDACPECMAKICWLSDIEPTIRYERLAEFCRKNGMNKEADEFVRKSTAVKK
jgi:archaemetzincin